MGMGLLFISVQTPLFQKAVFANHPIHFEIFVFSLRFSG
jgi:hypothetical protein